MSKSRILAPVSVALIFIFANTSCKKDQSNPQPPPIDTATTAITSIFPASASAGDTIKIRGRNLGHDVSQFHLALADSLQLQIYQAQDSFVSAILPSASRFGFFGTRQYHLGFARTSPAFSTTIDIGITCPQPKGWFQLYKSSVALTGSFSFSLNNPFQLLNDSVGLLHGSGILQKTTDGGATWNTVSDPLYYVANIITATDADNLWAGSPFTTSSDGGKTFVPHTVPAMLGNDFYAAITRTSPTTGMIAGTHGELYFISGTGFDTTTNFSLDYKSQYWNGSAVFWADFSAVDNNNLMAVGRDPYNNLSPLVTIKTNGTYDEYYLPAAVTTKGLYKVQMISSTLAFALDADNNLLKYSGSKNWSLVGQKAYSLYFTSTTNGYIDYQGEIYQTTDGGQSWNGIFAHDPGEVVISFVQRGEAIWAVGENVTAKYSFIYKYNP